MCMLSKSYLRTSVAMAVAIPNCIGVAASVQAAVISCSQQRSPLDAVSPDTHARAPRKKEGIGRQ